MFTAFAAAALLLNPCEVALNDLPRLDTTDSTTTRVYFVRHGESSSNQPDANGIMLTSGKGIPIPLTEKGRTQATELGKRLITKLPRDADVVILASAAVRAQDTADRIFDELKDHCLVERGGSFENFCELGQGSWEGKPKDAVYDNALKSWESLSAHDKFLYPVLDTGETYQAVANRMTLGLQQVMDEYPNKTIFVVAHYRSINGLAIHLTDSVDRLSEEPSTPMPSMQLDNCDMVLIENGEVTMHIKSQV